MDALRPAPRLLLILTICAAFALALIGCSASQSNTATSNAPPAAGNSNKTTNANTAAATPGGDKIGVEECDDFLAKYEACLDSNKVPDAAKAQYKSALAQTRDGWRKAAATPQGKATLAQACKTMRDNTKQAMTPYGCTF